MATGLATIGVSLGSESCVVAVTNTSGQHNVCANADGDRATPTYVSFVGDEVLFGVGAKAAMVRQPMQSVPYLAPLLSADVVQNGSLNPKCEVEVQPDPAGGDDRVVFPAVDAEGLLPLSAASGLTKADPADTAIPHTAVELLAALLGDIKKTTIDGFCSGRPIGCATFAVPRYLEPAVVKGAVEAAGVAKDVRVIFDDVAALVAYNVAGLRNGAAPTTARGRSDVLVIDWGANVLAASMLRVAGGTVALLGHQHRFGSGAARLDKALGQQCCQTFQRKTRLDATENGRAMRKLYLALESVRKTLTVSMQAPVDIDGFCEGVDLKDSISRVKLEATIRDCGMADALGAVLRQLTESIDTGDNVRVDTVILAGGFCRTPLIQQMCRLAVPNALKESLAADVVYLTDLPTDEIQAVGACVESALSISGLPSLIATTAETKASERSREITEECKSGDDVVDVTTLEGGVAFYTGAGPFASAATFVEGSDISADHAAPAARAVAAAKTDFMRSITSSGMFVLPRTGLAQVVTPGAPVPLVSPIVKVPVGSSLLPLLTLHPSTATAADGDSGVVPLLDQPVKVEKPFVRVLVTTAHNGGVVIFELLQGASVEPTAFEPLARKEW